MGTVLQGQRGATTRPACPPTGLLRTQPQLIPGGRLSLHFTSAIPASARECACARASRSGSSSDKARSAAGPGVRGASVRRVAGRGGAQEAGADQRGRTEPAGPTVTGPSPPLPSPPRPPSLRSLFPYAGSGSLPEARGALPRAPRVSLPPRGGRGSGAVGRYRYYPFPETSRSRGRGRLGIP